MPVDGMAVGGVAAPLPAAAIALMPGSGCVTGGVPAGGLAAVPGGVTLGDVTGGAAGAPAAPAPTVEAGVVAGLVAVGSGVISDEPVMLPSPLQPAKRTLEVNRLSAMSLANR